MNRQAAKRIAALNDRFRQTFIGGRVLMTKGVQALPKPVLIEILKQIQTFSDFTPDNDPYGEHDFGKVIVEYVSVFWKIDYYDQALEYHSEDAANPNMTIRILTILLAEEY